MRLYIIAGEASGDLHGSNLIRELRIRDPAATIRCWGGEKMEAAGAELVKHYRHLAFMGFLEVIKNLPAILGNLSFCKKDIEIFQPDALILIDYPGFNLRIAQWAKEKKIKVVYYISPQVWAWKENRVKIIKRCVDKMLVILPFEKEFYRKWNYEAEYVGHPLLEEIASFREKNRGLTKEELVPGAKTVIAILPGSRKQEISEKLPIMLMMAKHFPQYQFVIAKAPGIDEDFYFEMIGSHPNVSSVINKTYALLSVSSAALVTSGTATLETALFGVPQVICYKGSPLSYYIARKLVKIKFIGLVNLIMNKEVVKELIQADLNEKSLLYELDRILNEAERRKQIEMDYTNLKNILSQGGHASANAAQIIFSFLNRVG